MNAGGGLRLPGDPQAKPLPAVVKRLGWVSFCTDVASEMAYPVVPLFLATVLGAPALALGVIEGVAEAIVSLMKGWSGWHSDRTGRRVSLIRLGYGLGALSKPLLALAFAWPMVFLARGVDRLGKGLRVSARDALVADAVDARDAGRAYGFGRMMDTFGAMTGAFVAMGLLWLLPGGYRLIFLLATIPGLITIWLTFGLREARAELPATQAQPRPCLRQALRAQPPAYWRTLVPLGLFALANSSDAFLLLRARNLGMSDMEVVLAYALFNLVYAASAFPLGVLSDRVGRWPMLCCGWALYAAVYFWMGEAPMAGLWLLFPIYGLYMGLTDGASKTLIAVQTEPGTRGLAIGMFQMVVGLMTLCGSLLAGLLWDVSGPASAFRLGGGMALAALAALFILAPWRHTGRRDRLSASASS